MSKQISFWSLLAGGAVLALSVGCIFVRRPATSDTIYRLEVQEVSKAPRVLRVSGGSMNSSRRVGKVSQVKEGNSIVVLVYLTTGKGTGTGHFSEDITLDDSIDSIKFGPEKKVIWEKSK